MEQFDDKFKRYIFNRYIPIPVVSQVVGLGQLGYNRNVYCPFHDNTDTPAAHVYHDEEGDVLFCYSERRRYKPFDFLRQLYPNYQEKFESMFQRIWMQLSDKQKEEAIQLFGEDKDFISEENREILGKMSKFKSGRISFKEVQDLFKELT